MNINKKICIIVSDFRGDYNDDFVIGCEKEANFLGYCTDVFCMPQISELDSNNEESVYKLIDYNNYDGVIYIARSFSRHKQVRNIVEDDLTTKCKIPVITIGKSNKQDIIIRPDCSEDVALLTEHLIKDHNCNSIYFLGGVADNNADFRHRGFEMAYERCGLDFNKESLLYGGYWIDCAEKLAQKIAFGQIITPDAVMCYNDTIAYTLIRSLYKYGIRVPEDIIVTGIDGSPLSRNTIIPITTIVSDYEHVGRKAVAALYNKITGKTAPIVKHPHNEITFGLSCGCGIKKPTDIRLQFELQEKYDREAMEFRNSRLEDKIFTAKSKAELTNILKNTLYLIPDAKTMSVNILDNNCVNAECIYMTQELDNDDTISFPARNIYPKSFSLEDIHNTHIIPLMFNNEMCGFLTIGYDDALIYGAQAKQYAKILSNGLAILNLRIAAADVSKTKPNNTKPVMTPPASDIDNISESETSNSNVLMVVKDEITYKIKSENILYCEAFNKKITVVTKSSVYECSLKLFELENLLKPKNFLRISKSVLVNMNKVTSYKPNIGSTLIAYLITKQELHVSRNYVNDFKQNMIK